MNNPKRLKRAIDGIVLINKQKGLSSNAVLQKVKWLYQAEKAGHTGSLDPLATGMLPICLGEATKFSQYGLDADKCYQVIGKLGEKTTTSDAEGEIIATADPSHITLSQLEDIVHSFIGEITQIPSMYSALKHNGKPLYTYARQGQHINDIKKRRVKIFDIDNLYFYPPSKFAATVTCSKGTYIRTLIEDIGEALHVYSHVTMLHRVYSKGFENYPMVTLTELESMPCENRDSLLLPSDLLVQTLPKLSLSNIEKNDIGYGRTIVFENTDGDYRLYDSQQFFLGIGTLSNSTLKGKRLVQSKKYFAD